MLLPLLVLSSVFLEDKQKFKHGGVMSAYLHGFIGYLESFRGIKMNNYMIYTPISSIMRVFACFECFCKFRI